MTADDLIKILQKEDPKTKISGCLLIGSTKKMIEFLPEPYIPEVGDRVFHPNLNARGIVTAKGIDDSGDSTITVVRFGSSELNVSTHFLEKL